MSTDLLLQPDTNLTPAPTLDAVITASTPSPTPTPTPQVVCLPLNGDDIKGGFHCTLNLDNTTSTSANPDFIPLTYQYGSTTGDFYLKNSFGLGDLIIVSILLTFLILYISEKLWGFILGKKVFIKRKNE